MKAGLVGPSYQMRSLNFDAQRCINLFPVRSESGSSKEEWALYGTPGLSLFEDLGAGPIRGGISCGNGRFFVLSNNTFYEISSAGVSTSIGTVNTNTSTVSMAENGLQVFIATGTSGYVFTFATNVFTEVTDLDFPGASYVTFQDGYFIVTPPNNQGKYYISSIYDGLTWDALDFATAESAPDGLKAPFSAYGQLFLFGEVTTEVWYNSGDVDFPYAAVSGGKMETGCISAFSLAKSDNSVFWLGQDQYGTGIVYRAQGYTPIRISTQAIEYILARVTNLSSVVGFCYQQEGHLFYILTGGDLPTSLVYDASTQLWHERAYLGSTGQYEQWRGIFQWFAFGKNLTGDRSDGKIYEIDLDVFTDNGQYIRRSRTFPHIQDESERFVINSLEVDFEGGVGLTSGQGVNPLVWLRLSKDGGHTWSNEYQAGIGALGNYKARAVWRRLGYQRDATFEVSVSDPVKVYICGAYFK